MNKMFGTKDSCILLKSELFFFEKKFEVNQRIINVVN